jgi:hypothetical protein
MTRFPRYVQVCAFDEAQTSRSMRTGRTPMSVVNSSSWPKGCRPGALAYRTGSGRSAQPRPSSETHSRTRQRLPRLTAAKPRSHGTIPSQCVYPLLGACTFSHGTPLGSIGGEGWGVGVGAGDADGADPEAGGSVGDGTGGVVGGDVDDAGGGEGVEVGKELGVPTVMAARLPEPAGAAGVAVGGVRPPIDPSATMTTIAANPTVARANVHRRPINAPLIRSRGSEAPRVYSDATLGRLTGSGSDGRASIHYSAGRRLYSTVPLAPCAAAFPSVGAWRSLAARSVRDAEVGGSNPLAPTSLTQFHAEFAAERSSPTARIGPGRTQCRVYRAYAADPRAARTSPGEAPPHALGGCGVGRCRPAVLAAAARGLIPRSRARWPHTRCSWLLGAVVRRAMPFRMGSPRLGVSSVLTSRLVFSEPTSR